MLLPARKDIDVVLEDLNNTYGLNFCHYPLMHNNFDLSEFEREYSPEKIWVFDHSHEGFFPYESMKELHKLFDIKILFNKKKLKYLINSLQYCKISSNIRYVK